MENPFGIYAATFARDLNLSIDDRMLVEGFTATVADQDQPSNIMRLAVLPGRSGEELVLTCNLGTIDADKAAALYADFLADALLPEAFNMNYYLDPSGREVTAAAVLGHEDLEQSNLKSYAEAFLKRIVTRLRHQTDSAQSPHLDWQEMTPFSQSFV